MADNDSSCKISPSYWIAWIWFAWKRKPSILGLFFSSSPSTITRLIVTVVINSFNSKSIGRFSHIKKKIFKGINPSIANFDSSAAVSGISFIFRICASVFHRNPRGIGFSSKSTMFRSAVFCDCFKMQAPARLMMTTTKIMQACNCFFAAITKANPRSFFAYFLPKVQSDKSCKSLACNVKFFHAPIIDKIQHKYNMIGHVWTT